jgi:hypothetical protein
MSNIIRKISIGADYKNEAMHYAVGQSVYGGHSISNILFEEGIVFLIYCLKKKIILTIYS